MGSIVIGMPDLLENANAAFVTFGQLNFDSFGYVTVNESDGMYLVGENYADKMDLRTSGYLLNAEGAEIHAGFNEFETRNTFQSAAGILLATHDTDLINLCGTGIFVAAEFAVLAEPGLVRMLPQGLYAPYTELNLDFAELMLGQPETCDDNVGIDNHTLRLKSLYLWDYP